MSIPESFANYPTQIGETTEDIASKWTPREALISTLRDIDNGTISPETIVILFHHVNKDTGEDMTGMVNAGKNRIMALGLAAEYIRKSGLEE